MGRHHDPKGYRALKSIDSYQAVKDGTAYPAAFCSPPVSPIRGRSLQCGEDDGAAAGGIELGQTHPAGVDYDAGHGIGSTRSQQDRESADTYAFLLRQRARAAFNARPRRPCPAS
jgi:prolyl oligopeptidase